MLQCVDNRWVYVVDFDTMPKLPITGNGWERPYADALTQAFGTGIIRKPGKYGVFFTYPDKFEVFEIIE